MAKKFFAIILLMAIIGCAFFYSSHEEKVAAERASELKLFGNVDVREVTLAFRQSDRIAEIFAEEGNLVKEGQLLARLDNRELKLTIEKARSQIQAQEAILLKLKNGTRPEDLAQAQARIEAAQAILHDAEQHYNRIQKVYDETVGSAITRDELTSARLNYQNKSATLEEARQAYNLLEAGTRYEDIAQAEAQLKTLQDELARQEFLLTQYELTSPNDGVIRSRLLEVGDMASPSAPVFKISLNERKWIRAYVNETDLGKVFEGQTAKILIDSYPNEEIFGQIGYISSTAEFTPKTVQTDELRTSLVYEIRVYVNDPKNILRLGMPATVEIDLK